MIVDNRVGFKSIWLIFPIRPRAKGSSPTPTNLGKFTISIEDAYV